MDEKSEGGQPDGLAPLSDSSYLCRVDDPANMQSGESRQGAYSKRVRVYIDGFNLYHAIAGLKDQRLKWLNFWRLSETLLEEGEILDEVNFFTAVLTWNKEKQQRHVNFLNACRAVGVRVHEANFKQSHKVCLAYERQCKFFEEKQTDVAIAVMMVSDAIARNFDRAILITADSDQVPTARFIAQVPGVKLTLIFPPGRKTTARELSNIIPDRHELSLGRLLTCQLPRSVSNEAGRVVATMPALYMTSPISN